MPRLSRAEVRDLGKVAQELMAVHESLQHTNWGGAQTSAVLVARAIEVIARVYVRTSPALPEIREARAAEELARQQQETGAADGPEQPAPAAEVPGAN